VVLVERIMECKLLLAFSGYQPFAHMMNKTHTTYQPCDVVCRDGTGRKWQADTLGFTGLTCISTRQPTQPVQLATHLTTPLAQFLARDGYAYAQGLDVCLAAALAGGSARGQVERQLGGAVQTLTDNEQAPTYLAVFVRLSNGGYRLLHFWVHSAQRQCHYGRRVYTYVEETLRYRHQMISVKPCAIVVDVDLHVSGFWSKMGYLRENESHEPPFVMYKWI
jgi:hypothetical protein